MAYTFDEAMNAARSADAAGDHDAAQQLVQYAQTLQTPSTGTKTANLQSPQMSPQQGAQPRPAGEPQDFSLKTAAQEVAKDTGIGAAVGAIAPELTMGAGLAVGMVPGLQPVGAAIFAGGEIMRGARIASAVIGAGQAALSSTAGQVAKASGASKATQTGIELGVGLAGPSVAGAAGKVFGFVSSPLKAAFKMATSYVSGEEDVKKAVKIAQDRLSAPGSATQPQIDFHATLQQGIEADRIASQKAAQQAIDAANKHADSIAQSDARAAQSIRDEGARRAQSIRDESLRRARVLDAATEGKLKTARQVQAAADKELTSVGQPVPASDIGNSIRSQVTQKQGAAIDARNKAYQELQKQRDAIVAEKQAAGNTIDKTPEMKQLKAEIDKLTLDTKAGQKASGGLAHVTDQAQLRDLRSVKEAISNRRVQTGVDESGNPTYKTFPTTFEAIDDVRRRIGQQLGGEVKEGYAAIGQQHAQRLYARLSDIQDRYVGGGIQKQLQGDYAAATGELAKFKTGTGKAVTAVDRLDPEAFVKDPATLPQQFFKSQQSYRDLKELVGNDESVRKMASDWTASQLQGKSSVQARDWIKKNQDWLREAPGVAFAADHYSKQVEKIERLSDKLTKRVGDYQREKGATLATAEKQSAAEIEGSTLRAHKAAEGSVASQERVREGGQKQAAEIRKVMEEKADAVVKKGFPAESTRKLLTTGTPEEIAYATKHLAGTPGGKKAIEGAVRGVLRDAGPRNVGTMWEERVKPMLQNGQLLPPDRFAKLEKDVQAVLQATNGKPKPGAVASLVRNALTTSITTGAGHLTEMKNDD